MNKKIILSCIGIILCAIGFLFFFLYKRTPPQPQTYSPTINNNELKNDTSTPQVTKKVVNKSSINKQGDLYTSIPDSSISLEAISELTFLPKYINNFAKSILDNSNNIYMVKKHDNKVIIIHDEPNNYNHGLEITEIPLSEENKKKHLLASLQEEDNDHWEFDETTEGKRPIKHIKYDNNGEVLYTEIWNYEPDEEIKYEKTNIDGKIISMKKELSDENGCLREENLFYDAEGNTNISISRVYDGANLIRFTYYNAEQPAESNAIFNLYTDDGIKSKETVYSSDYKLQNTYLPSHKDGIRNSITVLDNNNEPISKISSD